MDKLNEMVEQKLTKVFSSIQEEISKFGNIALQMEKNITNLRSDPASETVHIPYHARTSPTDQVLCKSSKAITTPVRPDAAQSLSSVSLLKPQPFQTQPGSSCCDHICRPDLEKDPDYEFCCRHRCRKPWT